jgi:hypothetical protein
MSKVKTASNLNPKQVKDILDALELPEGTEIEAQSYDQYGLDAFEIDGAEYILAHNDNEADKACEESIKDTLWAFNADFIYSHTDDSIRKFDIDNFTTDLNEDDFETEDEYYEELDAERDAAYEKIFSKLPQDDASSDLWQRLIEGEDFVKALKKVQENYSEDANDLVLALIESDSNLGFFVRSAIQADGRGHFLSGYDGEEIETKGGMYIYRTN